MKKEQFSVTGLTEMTVSTSLQNLGQFSVLLARLIMKIQQLLGEYCAICTNNLFLFMMLFCIFFTFSYPFIPHRKPFTGINHSLCTPRIVIPVTSRSSLYFCFPGFCDTVLSLFFIPDFFSESPNVRNVLFHLLLLCTYLWLY